jgi:hypothetical protein
MGGYYIHVGSVYLKKSESSVLGMKEYTCLHSEPTRKGREKKNPGINPRQPVGQGWEKKNPGINPGQPVEKGRKKKP